MSKFKVGDKVKVTKSGSNFTGQTGIIEHEDSLGTIYVHKIGGSGGGTFKESELSRADSDGVQKLMDSLAECGSKMDALATRVDSAAARKDAGGPDALRRWRSELKDLEAEARVSGGSELRAINEEILRLKEEIKDEEESEKVRKEHRKSIGLSK